jgi:hypothetical protein
MFEIEANEIEAMKRKGELSLPFEMYINAVESLNTAEKILKSSIGGNEIAIDLEYARKNAKGLAVILERILTKSSDIVTIPVQEKTIDTFELADIAGVSAQMIRRKCESGEIKADRGKRNQWLIPESELSNPVIQRWMQDKITRFSQIKEAQSVLNKSKTFIDGLKEEEEARKADSED